MNDGALKDLASVPRGELALALFISFVAFLAIRAALHDYFKGDGWRIEITRLVALIFFCVAAAYMLHWLATTVGAPNGGCAVSGC